MEAALKMWERKILRTTYGPADEYDYCRMQKNQEMFNKFKSPYSVTAIKVCALEWSTARQAESSRVRFQMV